MSMLFALYVVYACWRLTLRYRRLRLMSGVELLAFRPGVYAKSGCLGYSYPSDVPTPNVPTLELRGPYRTCDRRHVLTLYPPAFNQSSLGSGPHLSLRFLILYE